MIEIVRAAFESVIFAAADENLSKKSALAILSALEERHDRTSLLIVLSHGSAEVFCGGECCRGDTGYLNYQIREIAHRLGII